MIVGCQISITPLRDTTDAKDLEVILGPLEADVLNVIYEIGKPIKVREVYEKMKEGRKIAYTTVMSTMNTLHEKGILDRKVTEGKGGLLYVLLAEDE